MYAITTDIWSSRHLDSYTGLTIHYIDGNFELQSHLLDTREFSESHTGENIATELKEILGEWNMSLENLVAATTDNGSNIVLTTEMLDWTRMPCFSHTLQLAVEVILKIPEVVKALARCRRLVTHFRHSPRSTHLLRQKQTDLHHPQEVLTQDVSTRWNSAYYMVQRITLQQQPLCATLLELRRGDLMPSDRESSTI